MPQPKVLNAATGMLCHGPAIANPAGGATIDVEARTATGAILAALRIPGVIAGAVSMPVNVTYDHPRRMHALSPAISDPSGGTVIDTQARTTISAMLAVLRSAGIVAGGTVDPAFTFNQPTMQLCYGAAITDPTGGTPDPECRAAITSALTAMRSRSLITGAVGG